MKKEGREKQLVKNTVIVAIGKICTQFISFFLLPLYTALLSTEEYGTVDLLNTCVSLIIPIFFFQMDQAIFRFLIDARKNEEEKKTLISSCLITICIQVLIYIVLYMIFSRFINNNYKLFLATNVIASTISSLLLQISRGLGDNTTYSMGSLISGAGTVLFNVLFIAVFKWGANGMLLATLLANVLCSIFVFLKKKLYIYVRIKNYVPSVTKNLWKYSIPLIPNQLSWWVVNVSDRLVISTFIGVGMNGIYSAANKFSGICITMFNIFNMTWSESASMHIKDDDSAVFFSKIIDTTLKIFISLVLLVVAFMPFIFKLLITGSSFADAYYQIPILMASTIVTITVSLFGSVYVALKKSGEIAKTSIFAAIINIIINVIFINKIGLYAASISTFVAYLAMSIYRYIDVQKYVKIKLSKKLILSSLVIFLIIIIPYYLKNMLLCICSIILVLIFSYVSNKDILKNLFSIFLNKINSLKK